MPVKLHFEKLGSGIPIILLHAYALDHHIWLPVAERMRSQAEVILPDLRGHGESPAPQGTYTMQSMAEDILLLMNNLSIDKAIIAGHSMGGYVSLAFAGKYPDRLLGFALVASHAYADPPDKKEARLYDIQRIENMPASELLKDMPKKLSRNPFVSSECEALIAKMGRTGIKGVLGGMAERQDSIDVLKNLMVPAVIIAGIDDQLIPIEVSREMARQMKTPWIVEIEQAGHMPMMEKPDITAETMIKLINKL